MRHPAQFQPAAIPPEAEALRAPVRDFLAGSPQLAARTPALRARTWTGWDADFSRALAAEGWVGLTMPPALGGAGLTPWHRFVVVEELLVAGAPVAAHWIGDRQSAPLILKFGTAGQQRQHIPAICRSERFFCIGMSEPGAGSDLASVRTRAVRDGAGWRLSGRKIWTTHAHRADMMIALARTSGTPEDRQKGLSQFLVDLKAPGITIRPIPLLTGDSEFAEVHFDEVALPADALLGAEGEGWRQVTAELAFERSGPERFYSSALLLDLWAATLTPESDPRELELLGRLTARLAALRALSLGVTAQLAAGESPVAEAAIVKDLGTGFEQAIPELLADRIAADAPPELLETLDYLLRLSAVFSLRGGTREILRGMIARALGLR